MSGSAVWAGGKGPEEGKENWWTNNFSLQNHYIAKGELMRIKKIIKQGMMNPLILGADIKSNS